MPKPLDENEFKRIGREVFNKLKPKPRGGLSVSITFDDGMPLYLEAGDAISGANSEGVFEGYFDGLVTYDANKGWALQIKTLDNKDVLMYIDGVKQFRIYD